MFGEIVLRYRWFLMVLLLAVAASSVYLLPGITIDQNFAKHFPDEDPDLEFYHRMTAELGDEDDLLMVAVRRSSGIFDSVFLEKFHAFTLALDSLPNVSQTFSLTKLDEARRTPFGVVFTPFLHLSEPSQLPNDSLRLAGDPRLIERLVSTDMKTLAITLEIKQGIDGNAAGKLVSGIEEMSREFGFEESYLMGRKFFEVTYNRISNRELKRFTVLCIGLIVVLLGLLYRSFWGVMLPVLVFVLSMLIFLGYLVATDHPLDVMSNLVPTILLIVSVSDVVHFFSKYEDQIKTGLNREEALKSTLNSIGLAIFLTSFTTAIGFLTLLTSGLPSMRKFGLDVAIGVMLAFLITIILVPFVLRHVSTDAIRIRTGWYRWWHGYAHRIYDTVTRRSAAVLIPAGLLTLVAAIGLTRINTNNFFVSSLPKGHSSRVAVDFFEKNLGGIRTFEVALSPKNGKRLDDPDVLAEVEKLHQHIDSLPLVGGVYSPATYFKSLNRAWYGGNPAAYKLPESEELLKRQERFFDKKSGDTFKRILNEDKTFGKISARMNDLGRSNVKVLNGEIHEWINARLDTSLLETHIIGASAMADKIQEHAIRNLFSGLALALVTVGLLILIVYRRWWLLVVVLLANIFPLILTGGLMALLGIELRYGTSIIFTIGFVIAVDDTIHFLSRYRLECSKGKPADLAVQVSLLETGRAMLLTSLILFFGFAILVFSEFRDAQAVGILVSFMLVTAIWADLFLSPWLLLKNPPKDVG